MERLEPERMDQGQAETDLVSEAQAAEGRAAEGRAAEVQLVWAQDRADLVAEIPLVGAQAQVAEVAVDRAAVHKQPACGLEQATMEARLLFREWSPVLRGELLAGAASPQKKSFWGFSER
jgi:hypothetical protein